MSKTRLDTTDWKTHCFGRQLVDLPPDVQPLGDFKFNSTRIKRVPLTIPALEQRLAEEEKQLRDPIAQQKTRKKLEKVVAYGNGSKSLFYSVEINSTTYHDAVTYFVTADGARVYDYSSSIGNQNAAEQVYQQVAQSLRSLAPNEIPTDAGFCIDGAILRYNELNAEEWDVGFNMPSRPGFSFEISAYVHGDLDDKPLLERTGGMVSQLVSTISGLSTLRRGKHPVGPIDGEEILVVGEEDGQRMYSFQWEAQGRSRSLTEPCISMSLGVLQQNRVARPKQPPFKDDDEALAFWDAVIDSIRLRPGAV